jgi:hypothetical protein
MIVNLLSLNTTAQKCNLFLKPNLPGLQSEGV